MLREYQTLNILTAGCMYAYYWFKNEQYSPHQLCTSQNRADKADKATISTITDDL